MTPRRIALRIAIHLGDIVADSGDIYGDGINVAARLQEFADPGGIVLSEAVHDLVRGHLTREARDLRTAEPEEFRATGARLCDRAGGPGAGIAGTIVPRSDTLHCRPPAAEPRWRSG